MFASLIEQAACRGLPAAPRRAAGKPINLALQGGGAHGAFTWGVLDQLLEDGRIAIDGHVRHLGRRRQRRDAGRRAGARRPRWSAPAARRVLARRQPRRQPARAAARAWSSGCSRCCRNARRCRGSVTLSRFFSPYDLNPLNINPLKDLIERFVDFERIRAGERDAVRLGHQCADRRAARVRPRRDHAPKS